MAPLLERWRGIKVCARVLAGYVCLPEQSSPSSTKEAPTPKSGLAVKHLVLTSGNATCSTLGRHNRATSLALKGLNKATNSTILLLQTVGFGDKQLLIHMMCTQCVDDTFGLELVCAVVFNGALGGRTVGRKLCKNEVNYLAWILQLNILRNTNHRNKGPLALPRSPPPAVSHLPNHQISHSSCQSPSYQSPSGSLDVEY